MVLKGHDNQLSKYHEGNDNIIVNIIINLHLVTNYIA